MYIATSQINR